jgi:glycosyltransferase involved in cell wall biosynthesis
MRSLDVLFILPSLETGGAERVAVNLANALQRSGHRARILLTARLGALVSQVEPSILVNTLDSNRLRSSALDIIRHLRHDPPDALVSTHTHVNLALCMLRGAIPARTRLVIREPIHAPRTLLGRSTLRRRLAQRMLYRRADLVLASSTPMLTDLRRLTGARVELLNNPVDVDLLRTSPASPGSAPAELDLVEGRRFVTVGRLTQQKLLPDLIRAFATATDPSDRLLLVGDGPLRAEIDALVRDLGIRERVILLGPLERPWDVVAQSDSFVLASRDEGMPNVVLESLAVGTPVIATDDLEVLRGLQGAAPLGAVELVPRAHLAEALRSVIPASASLRPLPTPSLLPYTHTSEAVVSSLVELLLDIVDGREDR